MGSQLRWLENYPCAFKNFDKIKTDMSKPIIDILVDNKIASSRREAREFIESGAISINGEKVMDVNTVIDAVLGLEKHPEYCYVTEDSDLDIADVNAVINYILKNQQFDTE